ncbi:4a-hydroxytetrahydrobiopterin dehydratase [Micromonospora taraxaci]|uniref:4a-hydroxytetrahydrobiopterin dehydratase n=1 Tax=Micromonospora taraxaci TaxID=1316803 RepID=UPI0033FF0ED4
MEQTLSRREASEVISDQGWRYLLGALRTSVPVGSLVQATDVMARAVAACGSDADGHLRADIRPDRVVLTLQSLDRAALTACDIDLAHRLSAARTGPRVAGCGPTTGGRRPTRPTGYRTRTC